MIVFRYDRTWEGLLTALFDAYARRQFPDALVSKGEPLPMFAESVFDSVADPEKSERVWRALGKKVPNYITNMIMYVWFSEEPGSDTLIFRYMRKVFDSPPSVIGDMADPDVLAMKKLGQKVSQEAMRHGQFVRFQLASDGTFFAVVNPIYNSLPLSLDYFRERFADQKWLIYDVRRRYGFLYDLEKVTEITLTKDDDLIEGKLADEMMAADEKEFQELWRGYHKSITIKERINPALQRRCMPARYWKYLTEMQ